jgi:hypothetical protein
LAISVLKSGGLVSKARIFASKVCLYVMEVCPFVTKEHWSVTEICLSVIEVCPFIAKVCRLETEGYMVWPDISTASHHAAIIPDSPF